jgi:hypothetical protein
MMIAKFLACFAVAGITAVPMMAAPVAKPTADFTVSTPTRVPGMTLESGHYTIRVVNQLSDRVILRVDVSGTDAHSTFIGVRNVRMGKPVAPGMVSWRNASGNDHYARGWYFPGDPSVVEFVYPKGEAVAIARSNEAKVLAIDPDSEGRPAASSLSAEDMQLITLWTLSPQPVGVGENTGGIEAERYQTASVPQKPVVRSLPHMASLMPVVWLVGVLMLISAGVVRAVRQCGMSNQG